MICVHAQNTDTLESTHYGGLRDGNLVLKQVFVMLIRCCLCCAFHLRSVSHSSHFKVKILLN